MNTEDKINQTLNKIAYNLQLKGLLNAKCTDELVSEAIIEPLRSTITSIQREMIEEIGSRLGRRLTVSRLPTTPEDWQSDGEVIGWNKAMDAIGSILDSLQSPIKEEGEV